LPLNSLFDFDSHCLHSKRQPPFKMLKVAYMFTLVQCMIDFIVIVSLLLICFAFLSSFGNKVRYVWHFQFKWIGSSIRYYRQLAGGTIYRTPTFGEEVAVGRRRWYRSKERCWVLIGPP